MTGWLKRRLRIGVGVGVYSSVSIGSTGVSVGGQLVFNKPAQSGLTLALMRY